MGFIRLHSGCVINTDMIVRVAVSGREHFVALVDGTRLNLYKWERENLEYYLGAEDIHEWHEYEVKNDETPISQEIDNKNPWAKDSETGEQLPFRKLDNSKTVPHYHF